MKYFWEEKLSVFKDCEGSVQNLEVLQSSRGKRKGSRAPIIDIEKLS